MKESIFSPLVIMGKKEYLKVIDGCIDQMDKLVKRGLEFRLVISNSKNPIIKSEKDLETFRTLVEEVFKYSDFTAKVVYKPKKRYKEMESVYRCKTSRHGKEETWDYYYRSYIDERYLLVVKT